MRTGSKKHIGQKVLITISILFALFYTHGRAYTLAFTYDECWTFLSYAKLPVLDIVLNTYPAANNHVLHSVLMKASHALFGMHEYALRLPVLLSFPIFLLYNFRLLHPHKKAVGLVVFTMLTLNPYLLDYFTAARGYGLALAFTSASVFYTLRFQQKPAMKNAVYGLLFALLAAWSNFTYLLIFITAWLLLITLLLQKGAIKKAVSLGVSGLLAALLLFAKPVHQLIQAKELYYGGREGFVADTIGTLLRSFTYHSWPQHWFWMLMVLVFAVVCLLFYAVWQSQTHKIKLGQNELVFAFLLLPGLGSILQNVLFETPFLIDRSAIFFIPLFFFALHRLAGINTNWLSSTAKAILMLFLTVNVYSMYNGYNVHYIHDYKEHSDAKNALQALEGQLETKPSQLHLGKSTYMNATLGFYRQYFDMQWLVHPELDFCDDERPHQYYYLFAEDYPKCVNNTEVEVVRYFPTSNTYLLKRTNYE